MSGGHEPGVGEVLIRLVRGDLEPGEPGVGEVLMRLLELVRAFHTLYPSLIAPAGIPPADSL